MMSRRHSFIETDEIYNLYVPFPIHYQYNAIKTMKTSVIAINMLGLAKRVMLKYYRPLPAKFMRSTRSSATRVLLGSR
jgi:hypothetical protein